MFGRGDYKMVAVKQIKISQKFRGISEEIKKCQTRETLEDCLTKQLIELIQKNCGCFPYELANFTNPLCVGIYA